MTTPDDITYRKATLDDIDTLIELRVRFLNDFFKRTDGKDTGELRENLRKYLQEAMPGGDFVAWLAESGGEVVANAGMVYWTSPPKYGANVLGKKGYILNMYTLPEFRRKGICTQLLKELLAEAKENGITYVHLHATMFGMNIYRKAGFKEPFMEEMGIRIE